MFFNNKWKWKTVFNKWCDLDLKVKGIQRAKSSERLLHRLQNKFTRVQSTSNERGWEFWEGHMFLFSKENHVGGLNYTKAHLHWYSYVNINRIYTVLSFSKWKCVYISLNRSCGYCLGLISLYVSIMPNPHRPPPWNFFNYGQRIWYQSWRSMSQQHISHPYSTSKIFFLPLPDLILSSSNTQ